MATKKKRPVRPAAKRRTGRKSAAAKRAAPKRRSSAPQPSAPQRRATVHQSVRKKRASKSTSVRRKERKVEEARHRLIDAEKELAVEQLPKKAHPATKKRGADPHVPSRSKRKHSINLEEQKLNRVWKRAWPGQIQ